MSSKVSTAPASRTMSKVRVGAPAVGPALLVAMAIGYVVLWVAARPAHQPTARFVGELCAAEALFLFSCALVLATFLRPLERAFEGLDRLIMWHRRAATAALVLLVPHVALITTSPDPYETPLGHGLGDIAVAGLLVLVVWALAPRLRAARLPGPIQKLARVAYERWLTAHRLTGLFVAIAVLHGVLVDPVLHASTLLRIVYFIVGGTGLVAYAYRELVAGRVFPTHDYTVAAIDRASANTITISLEPIGVPLVFTAGQFIALAFGGAGRWQRHPFSVASAPSEPRLQVTVKALGDYTNDLSNKLERGTPARVVGPFGGFDYTRGGAEQIWIAGGIGITPFLSWIRAMDDRFNRQVDLYYSVAHTSDAVYLDEIEAATGHHPGFRAHLVDTSREGILTAERMATRPHPTDLWVYMCGPPAMAKSLAGEFRHLGVPRSHLRWEQFDAR
jgi:predicted ferric reductase